MNQWWHNLNCVYIHEPKIRYNEYYLLFMSKNNVKYFILKSTKQQIRELGYWQPHYWWHILPPTVYPKKYAHGFVVLCFVVVMQSFIMNSHEVFIHIHQGCFAGTGAIVRLPQCQWSKPDGYGKISQCITTTKHSKANTVCIFLGIYCISIKNTPWRYSRMQKELPYINQECCFLHEGHCRTDTIFPMYRLSVA